MMFCFIRHGCNTCLQEENQYLRVQLESKEADTVHMVEQFSQLDSQKQQTQQVGLDVGCHLQCFIPWPGWTRTVILCYVKAQPGLLTLSTSRIV